MAEEINVKTNGTRAITLHVRLKTAEHTQLPVVANYFEVHISQGIAHVNFGFVEPQLLMEVGKRSHKGETAPKFIEGTLTTRVAIPLDSLLRLQQQLAQVVAGLQQGRAPKQS